MRERKARIVEPVVKPKKKMGLISIMLIMAIGMAAVVAVGAVMNPHKVAVIVEMFEKNEEQVFQMEPFSANLTTSGNSRAYVKTQISFSYMNEKNTEILEKKSDHVRDVILMNLIEQTSENLLDAGGLANFKETLKVKINETLGKDLVMEVFITDFLLQG